MNFIKILMIINYLVANLLFKNKVLYYKKFINFFIIYLKIFKENSFEHEIFLIFLRSLFKKLL